MTPDQMIAVARTWRDTPVRLVGYHKGHGVNCVGLWAGIAAECGLWDLFDKFAPYATIPHPETPLSFMRLISKYLDRYHGPMIPGLLLVTREGLGNSHVCGYTGSGSILETRETRVSEHRLLASRKVCRMFKVPGIDYGVK